MIRRAFIGLGSFLACAPTFSQQVPVTSPQATGSEAGGTELTEVVVTAQRHAQSVLDVPMSVHAVSGQTLIDEGIKDVTSVQFVTPGFLAADGSGFNQLYIRGVGNSIFLGADPSVATYIDDVPRIYATLVSQFVDVERIEVLKGAQGGLYGRNATGGVVNIVTRQPSTDAISGTSRVSYGEKNTFEADGFINLPMNDKVAVTFAVERESHGAYVDNVAKSDPYTAANFPTGSAVGTPAQTAAYLNSGVNPRSGLGSQDFWAGDGKLLFKPTENFKITIAGDYSLKQDTFGDQYINQTPAVTQSLSLVPLLASFGFPAVLPAGFVQGSGKFQAANGSAATNSLSDSGVSATAVWSLPAVDLTSITANRRQTAHTYDDLANASVPVVTADTYIWREFFYQELRAVSTNTGPFHFLGGLTYLDSRTSSIEEIGFFGIAAFNSAPTSVADGVINESVYAQVGYDITSHLDLTVSGREIRETNDTTFLGADPSAIGTLEKKFLPSGTLSYKLDGGGNIYGRFAEGFKAGGVNPLVPYNRFPTSYGSIFGPETVKTYEIGYRAPLFDRKVFLTSAVFFNDYRNLQTAAHATLAYPLITFAIVNADSARSSGVEESLNWQVTDPIKLGVNTGYLDAKYKNFAIPTTNPVLSPIDLSGTPLPDSPRWQLSFTGDLDKQLNDKYYLFGDALTAYVSHVIFTQSALPGIIPPSQQSGYWITNLRVGVHSIGDRYRLSVYANNVFNRAYSTYGSSSSQGTNVQWGNPRIVGVEAQYNF
jgi:iron complex outermembrane receptor protein